MWWRGGAQQDRDSFSDSIICDLLPCLSSYQPTLGKFGFLLSPTLYRALTAVLVDMRSQVLEKLARAVRHDNHVLSACYGTIGKKN